MTPEFNCLIHRRKQAFHNGETERFRQLRNTVNRHRKTLRSHYYATKANHLKQARPHDWWCVVKRIAGIVQHQALTPF